MANRFNKWITDAAGNGTPGSGSIAGKPISIADEQLAVKIKDLMKKGYIVDNKVMQVALPKLNESGNSSWKLFNWTANKPTDVLK